MPSCFRWRISHFGAASKASSCVCASLSLPCLVRRPAVAMERACRSITSFIARPLVVPWFEFWHPGVLCLSPVPLTLQQLKSSRSCSTRSRWLLTGFLPPTAGRSFIGGTSVCSSLLLRVTSISLAFGLATAVFHCGGGFTRWYLWSPVFLSFGYGGRRHLIYPYCFVHRPEFISGQSWPLLDFTLCGFSAGLCRSSLASPSWSPLRLCTG